MMPSETADDLRVKIANYKQSRALSARSMHRWLDALIEDAEQKLQALEFVATGSTTPVISISHRTATDGRLRSTYPFDENAPRQRPL